MIYGRDRFCHGRLKTSIGDDLLALVRMKGKRITTFIKAFRAACTKAGCPGRIPHDLRRTRRPQPGARRRSRAHRHGDERVAMKLTGHKTHSVFERYNIVSEGDLGDAAIRLELASQAPRRVAF